jgi:hypothetical protein
MGYRCRMHTTTGMQFCGLVLTNNPSTTCSSCVCIFLLLCNICDSFLEEYIFIDISISSQIGSPSSDVSSSIYVWDIDADNSIKCAY